MASIIALAKGTVIAQLVFVLVTPLLTRIYTAEEIGAFGLFVSIVLVASRFAGLRYEFAIPLPRNDRVAVNLVVLTSAITVSMLVMLYIGYQLLTLSHDMAFENHVLDDYAFFVALSVATFVINETVIFWFVRKKEFALISKARVINAVSLAMLQLAGFFFSAKLTFLVVAYPIALMLSNAFLFSRIDWQLLSYPRSRLRLMKTLIVRYRDFPIFSTWSSTLFELTQSLPLFVLTYFFGSQPAGYFFLARRIGLMPTSLVGRAISQVNHADMLEYHKANKLGAVMTRQIHNLQWLSVLPAFVIASFTPELFEILFGKGWRDAGTFLQLLTPYVVVRFVFSPLLAISYVAEWQRSRFWFEIVSSLLSAASLVWYSWHGNVFHAVGSYFLLLCVSNLFFWVFMMRRLRVSVLHLLKPVFIQLPLITALFFMLRAAA